MRGGGSIYQRRRERDLRFRLLRGWYGEEQAETEIAAYTFQPVNAADLMVELCGELADAEAGNFIEIESCWERVIGKLFAPYVRPVRLCDKVLYLEVRHSSLIRELTPSLDLFLKRIAEAVAPDVCREIRLVPAGSRGKTSQTKG